MRKRFRAVMSRHFLRMTLSITNDTTALLPLISLLSIHALCVVSYSRLSIPLRFLEHRSMSRLEKVPNELVNLHSSKLPTDTPDSDRDTVTPSVPFPLPPKSQDEEITLPQIPPQMESVRSRTADEIVQMMNKTPLFMTSLEDTADGTLHRLLLNPEHVHLSTQGRRREYRVGSHARIAV